MTQAEWFRQAQAGNGEAIAQLLNQALRRRGITAKTQVDRTTLKILLEYTDTIDQAGTIALIQQGLERLQPAHIQTVRIYGQPVGATRPTWNHWWNVAKADAISRPDARSHPVLTESPITTVAPLPPLIAAQLQANALDTKAQGALLSGLVLAIVLFVIKPLKVLFHGFLILVHEVGHAVTHWLFGRPAIPSVNLVYGGGITLTLGQSGLLLLLIYSSFAYLGYRLRCYPRLLAALGGAVLLYTLCLLTPTNEMLSVLMGHGMELVAIALCLYLAASGHLCRIKGDRTIYAMLGWFTLFSDVQFSWRLGHDADYRLWYEGGIGGVLDNDLVILANQYFGVDLSAIATVFLAACLLVPAIAFLAFRYEPWLLAGLQRLGQVPPKAS